MNKLFSMFALTVAAVSLSAFAVEPQSDAQEPAKSTAKNEANAPDQAKFAAKNEANVLGQAKAGGEVKLPTQMTEAEMEKVTAGTSSSSSCEVSEALIGIRSDEGSKEYGTGGC